MKKKLDTSLITNELRGQSAFFPRRELEEISENSPSQPVRAPKHPIDDTVIPRHHDTMKPSNHGTTIPDHEEDISEVVRKAVKQIGKEAATYRFTEMEKQMLRDIKYTYERQHIQTSENEITRIAINYFVEDYKKNGENSMLAVILKKLNS